LAFLEEDDPFAPDATEPPDRLGPPDRDRQILVRRLIAVAFGLLILVLIVLGVRGCLNARKERQFENYVSDLSALVSESQQLSQTFFDRLDDPQNLSPLEFEAEIKNDRGSAEGLVSRAQGLDAPGELKSAQADLVLAFELWRDGLSAISAQIGTALGEEGSTDAIAAIAQDMQYFVAGDVLYRRAISQIRDVVADQCPNCGDVPDAQFLPDIDWLDEATVAEALGQVSGAATKPTAGVHGLGLVTGGVTAQPGDVTLTPDTPVTISGQGEPSLSVQVENQGDSEETDVNVTVEVDGNEAGSGTIDSIAAGEIATADVPLDPAPPQGEQVSLDVMVEPVPGEQVADNNEASYTVTFGG
jgi:CARDB protein